MPIRPRGSTQQRTPAVRKGAYKFELALGPAAPHRQRVRAVALLLALGAASLHVEPVFAQTWTSARGTPPLWQIIAIDHSGEAGWLYGAEDIAGDGANKFEADEAATDIRSLYADADADRLWVRAYVAANADLPAELVAFFFIDVDSRADTGGSADAKDLWPAFSPDSTAGGYERAIGVHGNGELVGVFRWNASSRSWMKQNPAPNASALRVELMRGLDPLRVAGNDHAYVQLALDHTLSGLDASCSGAIFVRSWLDKPAERSFGDELLAAAPCRPKLDGLGDPAVLRPGSCDADRDCPAAGRCRQHVCVFEYACSNDTDCRTGERCMGSSCVKRVEGTCGDASDCMGLVCDGGNCVACADNGARACASGLICTPNGSCADPQMLTAGSGATAGHSGGGGGNNAGTRNTEDTYPPGKVRGGSFHCAITHGTGSEHGPHALWYTVPPLFLWLLCRMTRSRRRRGSAS